LVYYSVKNKINKSPFDSANTGRLADKDSLKMEAGVSDEQLAPDPLRPGWLIWLVTGVTFANGLFNIIQMLALRVSPSPEILNTAFPFGIHRWSRTLTLVFGFALIYLSFHLLQRRRVAWTATAAIVLLSLMAHLGRGHVWYGALVPVLTLAVLLITRDRFTVRSEPRSVRRGVGLLVVSVVIAVLYGTAGFWLLERRDFGLNFHAPDALERTLREFLLVGNQDLTPHTRQARWFLDSLRVLGFVAGITGVYSLFRPLVYRYRTLPQERSLARQILDQHGRSALDYFKLWPDNSYFFSDDERCVIAYRVALNVALGLGDPVGPEDELEGFTRAFLRWCHNNGWSVAFHQTLPDLIPMYHRLGLHSLKLGEEGVVDLEHFATITANGKHFRHVRNKFEREGYTCTRHLPPHPATLLDDVEAVSNEWLSLPGRRERTFTLGQFDRAYINETPLFTLLDSGGRLVAFVNEIPAYPAGVATIDMMRHRVEVPNGAMDFLFLRLMQRLREEGYHHFNLGLAPFSGVGDEPDATLEERAIHQVFEHLNRFFSYKGLRSYKDKFEPQWIDVFLVYQGGVPGLIRTGLALQQVGEE
jgi:phosphatidylglycerol lysyltransferase